MERPRTSAVLPLALALALAAGVQAGEVLEQVPRDALGALVVRNLAEADAKFGNMLGAAGSRLPGPLALLKAIAGLDAGLDQRRDLLVVLLPPQRNSRQFHLAVWLPVRDYDALVRSLDGDPARRVAAVTIADEDLLVARQGSWAVVMDTDERDRLELLRDTDPSPPPLVAEWSAWIDTNDAALVVLPAGRRAVWAWAVEEGLLSSAPVLAPAPHDDDLFGPPSRNAATSFGWAGVRQSLRTALTTTPELARWAAEIEALACGLHLEDDGGARLTLRAAVSLDALVAEGSGQPPESDSAAPRMYSGGPFVVTGAGRVAPHWIKPLVAPYVRQQTNDVTAQFESQVSPEDLANLCESVEAAAVEVSAFSVLTRPGSGGDGIYTNSFLTLRVPSSKEFLTRAGGLADQWNAMVKKVDALKPLAFESRSITVADHRGREYAIDMVAAGGGPPLPEIKAAIEKLFGPGGKFRVQAVDIDETTVLLAVATESQVAGVLEAIEDQTADASNADELKITQELLHGQGQWQMFVSPSGYTEWLRRQLNAILGDVIGGPIVTQFPESPPVGVAGGMDGEILWTEIAVPVETLRGFAKFSRE